MAPVEIRHIPWQRQKLKCFVCKVYTGLLYRPTRPLRHLRCVLRGTDGRTGATCYQVKEAPFDAPVQCYDSNCVRYSAPLACYAAAMRCP
eukprot:2976776-Rhodomonas_salina.1